MRPIILLAALATLLALSGCGTRGNLTQLPGPHQPPVLERWPGNKPAPAPAAQGGTPGAGDLNTPPATAQ